jgi:hypothetical protein
MALDFEKYKKEQFCLNKGGRLRQKRCGEYKDKDGLFTVFFENICNLLNISRKKWTFPK